MVETTAKSRRISLFIWRVSGLQSYLFGVYTDGFFYRGVIQADNSCAVRGAVKGHGHSSHLCSCAGNKKLLSCFSNQPEVKLRSLQGIERANREVHQAAEKLKHFAPKYKIMTSTKKPREMENMMFFSKEIPGKREYVLVLTCRRALCMEMLKPVLSAPLIGS